MDLPTCSAEQETGEAIVSEKWQHPEAGGTQEGQESIVPEERQQQEAGGTQEGQEANVSEERQQQEAGGTQEDQEANVSEERHHLEAGGTQETRWELPKKFLANKKRCGTSKTKTTTVSTGHSELQQNCENSRKSADVAEEKTVFGSGYRQRPTLLDTKKGARRTI